jgi:hypothetical protein
VLEPTAQHEFDLVEGDNETAERDRKRAKLVGNSGYVVTLA